MSHIIKDKELYHQKNFKGEQTYPIFVWVLYKAKFQKISTYVQKFNYCIVCKKFKIG